MEIELSDSDEYLHRHDFNKLLQADAAYKVFVFQMKMPGEIDAAMVMLTEAALKYQSRSRSDFLLCAWCTSLNTFMFQRFVAEPR